MFFMGDRTRERLGRAIYWFMVTLGALVTFVIGVPGFGGVSGVNWEHVIIAIVLGALLALAGRLVRYVLANE